MYCKKLSTSGTEIRSAASVSQHLDNIPHISAVAPSSAFPLGRGGRSPAAILSFASAELTPSHNNSPASIYGWLIAVT